MRGSRDWDIPLVGKVYLISCVIESLGLLGAAVAVLVDAWGDSQQRVILYYSVISIFVTLCFIIFAIDAVIMENVFQLYASVLASALVTIWAIFQYVNQELDDISDLWHQMNMALLIWTCVFQVLFFGLAYPVLKSFGWRMYKNVGTSVQITEMYTTYQVFSTLVKIDLELGFILVLLATFFIFDTALEIILNIIAMLFTLLWAVGGQIAVRHEWRRSTLVFCSLSFVEPVYIISYLVDLKLHPEKYGTTSFPQFFIVGGFAIVLRCVLMLFTYYSMLNFGKGLRNRVFLRYKLARRNMSRDQLGSRVEYGTFSEEVKDDADSEYQRL